MRYAVANFKIDFVGSCIVADPETPTSPQLTANEVTLELDPELSFPGEATEFRRGKNRYFIIRINPRSATFITFAHECAHLLNGHTAVLRLSEGPHRIAHVLLDISIWPDEAHAAIRALQAAPASRKPVPSSVSDSRPSHR